MKYIYGLIFLVLLVSCEKADLIEPAGIAIDMDDDTVIFAEIGDFGWFGKPEMSVSRLVKSWNPDFIISAGDNNYSDGEFNTLEYNISYFYGDYIYNYDAPSEYRCNGLAFRDRINRFFPTPGNHDSYNKNYLMPYYNYFTLPGNEKYYRFDWGPASFFSINTVEKNLDEQKSWLENELRGSEKPFKIVFLHHPPYSSGSHGDQPFIQWDFDNADVVFAAHDHIYQRIIKKNSTSDPVYIVNGLGGKALGNCVNPHDPSEFLEYCFGSDYGAVKGTITAERLELAFYSISSPDIPIDIFVKMIDE